MLLKLARLQIFDFLEFRRLSSSINSIFSNVEKPNPEIQNKTEEIIENAGHGQFNLFENNQEINVVSEKKVIDQEIISNTSLVLFLNRLKKQKNVSYSFLTEGNNFPNLEIKNISFSWENNLSYSINDENRDFDKILKIFFEDKNITKISNDIKQDIKLLSKKNIKVHGGVFDIKLAHYLGNPYFTTDSRLKLKIKLMIVSQEHLGGLDIHILLIMALMTVSGLN